MGLCCAGSQGEPSDADTCRRIGGDYHEKSTESCISTCAFLGALHDYVDKTTNSDPVVLLAMGGTYSTLYDFRDHVLKRCEVGRKVLSLYREHSARAIALLLHEPELLVETLRAFLMVASFSREIVRVAHGARGADDPERRLNRKMYKLVEKVGQGLREVGAGELDEPVDYALAMFHKMIEMTPEDVFASLRVD